MQSEAPEKTNRLSTMTSHQMFTLWWGERWVRNLVLLLTPIGLVDAIYTILLFRQIGAEFEYNPLVRAALLSEWWVVWFIIDALSFFLFIMMAGSYYLHTRHSLVNNRTGLVSGLVAIRVGLAAHNVVRFQGEFSALFAGFMFGVTTYIIMDSLLDRRNDVSWEGFKQWWKHITDRRHDDRLIRKAIRSTQGDDTQLDEKIEKEIGAEVSNTSDDSIQGGSFWRKRAMYLLGAIALFIIMPYFLVFLGDITGVTSFTDIYGSLIWWNELSAPAFLLGFVSICIFTASIMYLILRSFDVQEGAW